MFSSKSYEVTKKLQIKNNLTPGYFYRRWTRLQNVFQVSKQPDCQRDYELIKKRKGELEQLLLLGCSLHGSLPWQSVHPAAGDCQESCSAACLEKLRPGNPDNRDRCRRWPTCFQSLPMMRTRRKRQGQQSSRQPSIWTSLGQGPVWWIYELGPEGCWFLPRRVVGWPWTLGPYTIQLAPELYMKPSPRRIAAGKHRNIRLNKNSFTWDMYGETIRDVQQFRKKQTSLLWKKQDPSQGAHHEAEYPGTVGPIYFFFS